jgi:Na+-driven multidrug efflux pump
MLLRLLRARNAEAKDEGAAPDLSDRRRAILGGSVGKTLFVVTWPLFATMQLYNLLVFLILFWVGRLGGPQGLDAWLVLAPITLLASLVISDTISDASGSLIAQSVGANDQQGRHILRGAMQLCIVSLVGLLIIGAIVAVPVTEALAGDTIPPSILLQLYLPWLLFMFPIVVMCDLLLGAILSTGWTSFGIVRVLFDLAFTFVLVPLFTGWLGLGMAGPPLAVGVSAGVLTVLVWSAIKRYGTQFGLGPTTGGFWDIDRSLWKKLISIGLPPQLGRMAGWISQIIFMQMLAHEGKVGDVAGFGLAFNVLIIVGTLGIAVSSGCAIMVGQNMGAGQVKRAMSVLSYAATFLAILIVAFLVWTPFAGAVFRLISNDAAVVASATDALSTMRWAWIAVALYQLLNSAFLAVGATKLAAAAVVACEVIGVSFALLYSGPVLEAVTYGFCVAVGIRGVLMLLLVRRSLIQPLLAAAAKREEASAP